MKYAVITFGRLNPPTIGHQALVDKVKQTAKDVGGTPMVYLSHSQDSKKNPLSYEDKIKYSRKAFGAVVKKSKARTIIEVLKELQRVYTGVFLVVGSDRIQEFTRLITKYNGKEFNFDKIEFVSAGERDPDADDVSGMSASKMRAAAQADDYNTFKKGTPKGLSEKDKKDMYDKLREGMDLIEEFEDIADEDLMPSDIEIDAFLEMTDLDSLDEDEDLNLMFEEFIDEMEEERKPLNVQQRMKIGRRMKRLQPKIQRRKKMLSQRMADSGRLEKRARKAAIKVLRKKFAGKQGQNYASLAPGAKMAVDKIIAKKHHMVGRISKKIMPKVRSAERDRLKSLRTHKEEVELDEISRSMTPMRNKFGLSQQEKLEALRKKLGDAKLDKYMQSREKGKVQDTINALYKQFVESVDAESIKKVVIKKEDGEYAVYIDGKKRSSYAKKLVAMNVAKRIKNGEKVIGESSRIKMKHLKVGHRISVQRGANKGPGVIVGIDEPDKDNPQRQFHIKGKNGKISYLDADDFVAESVEYINEASNAGLLKKYGWKEHQSKFYWTHKDFPNQLIRIIGTGYPGAKGMWYHQINVKPGGERDSIEKTPNNDTKSFGKGTYQLERYLEKLHGVNESVNFILAEESEAFNVKLMNLLRQAFRNEQERLLVIRALKGGEKALVNPKLRPFILKLLDRLLDAVQDDPSMFNKMRDKLRRMGQEDDMNESKYYLAKDLLGNKPSFTTKSKETWMKQARSSGLKIYKPSVDTHGEINTGFYLVAKDKNGNQKGVWYRKDGVISEASINYSIKAGMNDTSMKQIITKAFMDSGKDRKKFNSIVMAKTGMSKNALDSFMSRSGYDKTLKFKYSMDESFKVFIALQEKAEKSGIDYEILEAVYNREEDSKVGFDRVNSFINGGAARELDADLAEAKSPLQKLKDFDKLRASLGKTPIFKSNEKKKEIKEQDNVKRARERIKREKERQDARHDRMMDRARTKDTRYKNAVTEKTLTPAEKKKREEIAQAIERDNPNMPMDKKMAIATAQAKKVAETILKTYKDFTSKIKEEVELDEAKTDAYHKTMLKALGKSRLPRGHGYTSAVASNGDFVVYDGGKRIVGRLKKGEHSIKEEVDLDEVTVANAAKAFDIKKQAVALKAKIAKLKNTPGDAAHMKMIDAKRSFDKKIATLQALDVDAYEIKKLKESSLDEAFKKGSLKLKLGESVNVDGGKNYFIEGVFMQGNIKNRNGAGEEATTKLKNKYTKDTPGQEKDKK